MNIITFILVVILPHPHESTLIVFFMLLFVKSV